MQTREDEPRELYSTFSVYDNIIKEDMKLSQRKKVNPMRVVGPLKDGIHPMASNDLNKTAFIYPDIVMGKLMNAGNMNTNEVIELIGGNLKVIISTIYNQYNGVDYTSVLGIPSVINAMAAIAHNSQPDPEMTMMVDSIVYHCLVNAKETYRVFEVAQPLILELNRSEVSRLLAINTYNHTKETLTSFVAQLLAVYAHSAPDARTGMNRVNYLMATYDFADLFTEQIMVDVYVILFGNKLSSLFNTTMFDPVNEDTYKNFNRKIGYKSYLQVKAILDIINEQTVPIAKGILLNYYNEFTARNARYDDIRFGMNDFDISKLEVLQMALNSLARDGIIIP